MNMWRRRGPTTKLILISEFNIHALRGGQLCAFNLCCNRLLHPSEVYLAGEHRAPLGAEVSLRLSAQSAPLPTPEDYTDGEETPQHQFDSAVHREPGAPLAYHCLLSRKFSHPLVGLWHFWRCLHVLHAHCRVPCKEVRLSARESI